MDVVIHHHKVNLEGLVGNGEELAAAIDRNYGDLRWFNPNIKHRSGHLRRFGDDYADNARGIYYADDLYAADKSKLLVHKTRTDAFDYIHRRILKHRNDFIPSFDDIDWNSPSQKTRRGRAVTASSNAISNGLWNRSEFAWDADARSDIFGPFRNDCRLDMDKHEHNSLLKETDPTLFTFTGESRFVKRTPDETFALSTHQKGDYVQPSLNADVFRQDRLQRLLLHPKCGLISDPKWDQTKMVFPFGVYEAKGWAGDHREARRQACAGGHRYLNMLDRLAKAPCPPDESSGYQTERSHEFQVFVFTSYGAHWHLLVGIKHPRLPEQHAGNPGVSEKISLFRKIWSGSIETERGAWELLVLVDQIHEWAVSTFRDFVIQHLSAWHKYCDANYLLDWDTDDQNSKRPQSKKRKREISDEEDVKLPKWCDFVDEPLRRKMAKKEKESLKEMLKQEKECRSVIGEKIPPPDAAAEDPV